MLRQMRTKEARVAEKIGNLLNDVTLDLDEVGRCFVDNNFTMTYNRLILMTESAVAEKENADGRQLDTLF
jgi:hypothetical protein